MYYLCTNEAKISPWALPNQKRFQIATITFSIHVVPIGSTRWTFNWVVTSILKPKSSRRKGFKLANTM